MKIAKNVEINLTEDEMYEVYKEYKKKLDIEVTQEVLFGYHDDTILNWCDFASAAYYMSEEDKSWAVEEIIAKRELMLEIHDLFEEYNETQASADAMESACEVVLEHFGAENPRFLDAYKHIQTIVYERYIQYCKEKDIAAENFVSFPHTVYQNTLLILPLLSEKEKFRYKKDLVKVLAKEKALATGNNQIVVAIHTGDDEVFAFREANKTVLDNDLSEGEEIIGAVIVTEEKDKKIAKYHHKTGVYCSLHYQTNNEQASIEEVWLCLKQLPMVLGQSISIMVTETEDAGSDEFPADRIYTMMANFCIFGNEPDIYSSLYGVLGCLDVDDIKVSW